MISSRTWMLLLNSFFFLMGLGILSIGLWSQFDKNFSVLWNSLELSKLIDAKGLNGASLLLILSGFSSLIVSFIGLYGSLKKDKCFLTTYCLLMCIILILEIAAASVFISYNTQARVQLGISLNRTVEQINKNEDLAAIQVMNTVQTVFKCCGCDGPMDYKNLTAMRSCETKESTDEKRVYFQNGCYETIITYINTHLPLLAGLAISIILFQIFCLAISIRTCVASRYEGYQDI
jgi:hypothetical protein